MDATGIAVLMESEIAAVRARLLGGALGIAAPPEPADGPYDADAAQAAESADEEAARRATLLARLRALEAAHGRLGDGSYWRCEDCGGEIPARRLAACPTATRCVRCQGEAESEEARRARLGRRRYEEDEDGDEESSSAA